MLLGAGQPTWLSGPMPASRVSVGKLVDDSRAVCEVHHTYWNFLRVKLEQACDTGRYVGLCIFRRLKTSEFNRVVGAALAFAGLLMALKGL
jgi:hypothetical protein